MVLWWYEDPHLIREDARRFLETRENTLFLSPVVIWEIFIKESIQKLKVPKGLIEKATADFVEIPIMARHAQELKTLARYHTDPFDRMLIAQAKVDDVHLMTRDPQILKYDIKTIAA